MVSFETDFIQGYYWEFCFCLACVGAGVWLVLLCFAEGA